MSSITVHSLAGVSSLGTCFRVSVNWFSQGPQTYQLPSSAWQALQHHLAPRPPRPPLAAAAPPLLPPRPPPLPAPPPLFLPCSMCILPMACLLFAQTANAMQSIEIRTWQIVSDHTGNELTFPDCLASKVMPLRASCLPVLAASCSSGSSSSSWSSSDACGFSSAPSRPRSGASAHHLKSSIQVRKGQLPFALAVCFLTPAFIVTQSC